MEFIMLGVLLVIAHFTGAVAEQKGLSYWGFAFFSLFAPIIALIIAAVLQKK